MFKNSRELDRQYANAGFRLALRRYANASERWYDGSVDSVDARLGNCARLLHTVRATVARLPVSDAAPFLRAADSLEADKRALTALREDLLTGASNRADVLGPPGWRTAQGLYRDAVSTDQGPTLGSPSGQIGPPEPLPGGPTPAQSQADKTTGMSSADWDAQRSTGTGIFNPNVGRHGFYVGADEDSDRLHGPFAGYSDWEDCVAQNSDAGDADAYCGKIYHQVEEGRRRKGEPLTGFQDRESSYRRAQTPAAPTSSAGAPQVPLVDTGNPGSTRSPAAAGALPLAGNAAQGMPTTAPTASPQPGTPPIAPTASRHTGIAGVPGYYAPGGGDLPPDYFHPGGGYDKGYEEVPELRPVGGPQPESPPQPRPFDPNRPPAVSPEMMREISRPGYDPEAEYRRRTQQTHDYIQNTSPEFFDPTRPPAPEDIENAKRYGPLSPEERQTIQRGVQRHREKERQEGQERERASQERWRQEALPENQAPRQLELPFDVGPRRSQSEVPVPGRPRGAALDGPDRRWVALEAAKFVAGNTDTLDDGHELATRAHHHAAVKTSSFTPARSAALCEAFVARVCDLGRRTAAPLVRTASTINIDFAPEAMFL